MRSWFFILGILFTSLLFSQESFDDSYYQTRGYENIEFYKFFPLDINKADKNQLKRFSFLGDVEIDKIVEAQKRSGIRSRRDLENLGFGRKVIDLLEQYTKYGKTIFFTQVRSEVFRKNYDYSSFAKTYSRTLYSSNPLSFGFLTQKDEGEKDPLDYKSYFVKYQNNSIKSLIIGNYKLGFGQGIAFGSPFSFGKSTSATKSPIVGKYFVKPYTSFYENWLLEGVVLDYKIGAFNFVPFYSNVGIDANLKENKITSFYESGVHRDETKIDAAKEQIVGGHIQFEANNSTLGATYGRVSFDKKFEDSTKNRSYQIGSMDYIFGFENVELFGEVAAIDNKSGKTIGVKYGDLHFNQLLLYRDYEKDIPTYRGNPFSASGTFDNEVGLYYGLSSKLLDILTMDFYVDMWEVPQISAEGQLPTTGFEQMLFLDFEIDKSQILLKYRYLQKEELIGQNIEQKDDFQYKIDYIWLPNTSWRVKLRTQYEKETLQKTKEGLLGYQQLKYKNKVFETLGQIVYFNSDIPIYIYENNISNVSQTTPFSGEDFYYYLLAKVKVTKHLYIESKFSDYVRVKKKWRVYSQIGYKREF